MKRTRRHSVDEDASAWVVFSCLKQKANMLVTLTFDLLTHKSSNRSHVPWDYNMCPNIWVKYKHSGFRAYKWFPSANLTSGDPDL